MIWRWNSQLRFCAELIFYLYSSACSNSSTLVSNETAQLHLVQFTREHAEVMDRSGRGAYGYGSVLNVPVGRNR